MANLNYAILDIETCPTDLEDYFTKTEEERKKYINPIQSKIVAIGIRYYGVNHISFIGNTNIDNYYACKDEADLIKNFWDKRMKSLSDTKDAFITRSQIVGFNIKDFDMPFLVSRSFVHNIAIEPFRIKEILDLREKLSAYRHAPRGKLKEWANLIGLDVVDADGGSKVAEWVKDGKTKELCDYLACDLEITDALYKRCMDTKIDRIEPW